MNAVLGTKTCLENEAEGNSKMAYSGAISLYILPGWTSSETEPEFYSAKVMFLTDLYLLL